MFQVENIKDNDDYLFAYKIVEKQFIDNIVNKGQIYFSLLGDYRLMAQQNKCEIGDVNEAALTSQVHEYIEIDGQYEEIHGPSAGNNIRINANQCAFCFYMVGLKSFNKTDTQEYMFNIPYIELKKICKDKGGIDNCAIIIFDISVIHKIYDELKSRKLPYAGYKVLYDDFNYIPNNKNINSLSYALECCFHKNNKYSYQNEFRIVAINSEKKPLNDLFIRVDKNDFQVLELKKGFEFYSCTKVQVKKDLEKIAIVQFNSEHGLKAVTKNEIEI